MPTGKHPPEQLTFYPDCVFHLSPTWNTWARLSVKDVKDELAEREGVNGTFFLSNHPIRWIRLVGVIVAFDILPTRIIFIIDDSSGRTVDVTCKRARNTDLSDEKTTTRDDARDVKGLTSKGGGIDLTGVDVGTVVKIKGLPSVYRGERQVVLERISVVRSTSEEVAAWRENVTYKTNVLGTPWVVDENVLRKTEHDERARQRRKKRKLNKAAKSKEEDRARDGKKRQAELDAKRREEEQREQEQQRTEQEQQKKMDERREQERLGRQRALEQQLARQRVRREARRTERVEEQQRNAEPQAYVPAQGSSTGLQALPSTNDLVQTHEDSKITAWKRERKRRRLAEQKARETILAARRNRGSFQ